MAISVHMPKTRHQSGRMWATLTLVICGAFSLFANVRSGMLAMEPIIVSIFPPIVAFASSHLISYYNPQTKWTKAIVYGGFGLVCTFAMIGSGKHIVDTVVRAGQPFEIAVIYIFMTDMPMLLAAGILVTKVSTSKTTTKAENRTSPAKATTPAKKTVPAKAPVQTTAKKAATPRKTTKPAAIVPTFRQAVKDPEAEVIAA